MTTDLSRPAVVVVGSINLDVVVELSHLPVPGETIIADHVRRNVGGKGANQAVAAQLAGADVEFVGRVGGDADAEILRSGLEAYGVGHRHLHVVEGTESGVAYINVADHDNTIVVVGGANWSWHDSHEESDQLVAAADVVICQLEVPDETIERTAQLTAGRFVLNALRRATSPTALARCDPLVVNEHAGPPERAHRQPRRCVDRAGRAGAARRPQRRDDVRARRCCLDTSDGRGFSPHRRWRFATPPVPGTSSSATWPPGWARARACARGSAGRPLRLPGRCRRPAPTARTPISTRP